MISFTCPLTRKIIVTWDMPSLILSTKFILLIFSTNSIQKNGGVLIAIRYAKFLMEEFKGKKHSKIIFLQCNFCQEIRHMQVLAK